MMQNSRQNFSNARNPWEPTLLEVPDPVEVSDCRSAQLELSLTEHQAPSDKLSQPAIDSSIRVEPLADRTSEDLTVVQAASLPSDTQENNDRTVVQSPINSAPHAFPPAAPSRPVFPGSQSPKVTEPSIFASQPAEMAKGEYFTPNSSQTNSSQTNSSQTNSSQQSAMPNSSQDAATRHRHDSAQAVDNTVVQYSDSALHNPADQTVMQEIAPLAAESDQTVHQAGMTPIQHSSSLTIEPRKSAQIQRFRPGILQDIVRGTGSFTSRFMYFTGRFFHSVWQKVDLRQLPSRLRSVRPLTASKPLRIQPSASLESRPVRDEMVSEGAPSTEQYQKKLRELDRCRLDFSKELARNGKFRDAIAMASKVSETSRSFRDAQMLIRNWKQL
jgi:hypothetical protein